MTGSPVVSRQQDGHVATLWLDRPDARNAFGPEMWRDLPMAMAELSDDDQVRVVVLAAKGPAFSVGLDLDAYGPALLGDAPLDGEDRGSAVANRRALYGMIKRAQAAVTSVAECHKPVVAAVHGWCIGAGLDVITACDIRLAASDAMFSVRETKLAMVADVGTLQRLPGIISSGKVADLVYTGRDVTAQEALRIGLVDQVHDDVAATHKAAADLAAEIAANSPLAVQGSKAVLSAGAGRSTDASLDYVALWSAAFLQSDDLAEAARAFREKRPPQFRGK